MKSHKQTVSPTLRAPQQGRSAQVLVVTAVCIIGLLAIVGLIADGGMLAVNRRHAQRAADAAAQAGAWELRGGTGPTEQANARAAAVNLALLNGTSSTNCVLVEIPPAASSGSVYAGTNGCVRVEVTRPMDTTFMRLLLQLNVVNVRASATAGLTSVPYGVRILVTHSSASGALTITGSGTINAGSGTIYVNSSSSQALRMTGSATINAGTVEVVGGISQVGSGRIDATIVTGAPVELDPLASVPAPVLNNYPVSPDSGGTANSPNTKKITGSSTVTLRPGIYYGGIKVTGSGTINLQPGAYIMAGGGFTMTGSGALNGTDIFIYNTQDPYKTTGHGAYAGIDLTGSGARNLKAPDAAHDSTYKGILIFNNRASATDIKMTGSGTLGGDSPFAGYIYNPGGNVDMSGSGSVGGLGLITRTLNVTGSGTWTAIDPARTPGTTTVRLFE